MADTKITDLADAGAATAADYLYIVDGATSKHIQFDDFETSLTHDNIVAGTIASHDTTATGANLTTLTDTSDADALHAHTVNDTHVAGDGSDHADVATNTAASHAQAHTVASHSDTTITGAETETLSDGSNADALHVHEGTAIDSTGEGGGTKFLREDGDGTCSWQAPAGGGDALTTDPLSQFAATTSAQLAGVISDETGSSLLVFNTSPTLVTPVLGTVTSGNISACTSTNMTLVTPALGTPSACVLTNATALPAAQVSAGTFAGALVAADHGAAATDQIINVAYGTGAAPAANTTTIGSLYITHEA